jgi:hypothetical protein
VVGTLLVLLVLGVLLAVLVLVLLLLGVLLVGVSRGMCRPVCGSIRVCRRALVCGGGGGMLVWEGVLLVRVRVRVCVGRVLVLLDGRQAHGGVHGG